MEKLALPAGPTRPISRSNQLEGSGSAPAVTARVMDVVFVRVPEVPVIVIVAVPVVAVPPAVNVNALVLVVPAGLKEAVTPLGRPDADKLTLPLKPLCGVTVTVLVPLAPWATLKVFGEADRVKLSGKATVSEIVAVLLKLPDVPVMVTGNVPVVAVAAAVKVNVLVLAVEAGLKEAVTPLGRPEADKLTFPLKPFCGATVMVLVPLVPCVMLKLFEEAARAKLGAGKLMDTLSKVAVVKRELSLLLTAKPT